MAGGREPHSASDRCAGLYRVCSVDARGPRDDVAGRAVRRKCVDYCEHGTGKEVVAQTLHRLSSRAERTLVAVNTGALPEGTFESELFGHVKGAFTDAHVDRIGRFELASGGTLFLDEIANIPMRQQAKLLRVLETGELERVGSSKTQKVNVRMLSATNADLRAEYSAGRFREDLLFRLNTVEINLPPLRERREDIPALAAHFLSRYAARYRRPIQGLEQAALQMMLHYGWPATCGSWTTRLSVLF